MKIIKLSELLNGPIFQGDICISAVKVSEILEGNKKLNTDIVTHSESGHHHVAKYAEVLGGLDPMVMFLKPAEKAKTIDGVPYIDIVHKRPWDTHEPYRLLFDVENVYPRIDRQEEFTPEGWRRVED